MNDCTINIADFRCRGKSGASRFADRSARRSRGFDLAGPEGMWDRPAERLEEAVLQEDPPVYDIGIAREVQRLRQRAVFRPVSIERKAKVLRFRDELPVPLRMRAEEVRGADSWPGKPDGPYDSPPAA